MYEVITAHQTNTTVVIYTFGEKLYQNERRVNCLQPTWNALFLTFSCPEIKGAALNTGVNTHTQAFEM